MGLKKLRIKNGYSQEQLAQESNLSTRTIQRIEKEFKASDESLYALAKVFEMDYEKIKESIFKEEEISSSEVLSTGYLNYAIKHPKFIRYAFINVFLFLLNIINTPETIWFIYALVVWSFFYFYHRFEEYKQTS